MVPRPTSWNRFVAKLQGEVPAAELEAFSRASASVLELLDRMEHRRLACRIDGLDPWTTPPATRTAFLCAWNAFVLQTLADELLEADYRAEPRTPHFVPPVTFGQAMRCYDQVEGWVNRASQAEANPGYRLDIRTPAELPAWDSIDSPAQFDGLLRALRLVRDRADAAMEVLPEATPDDLRAQTQLDTIRQLYASARTRSRYAEDLRGADAVPEVHERAVRHATTALEQFYLLGQWIADPWQAVDAVPESTDLAPIEFTDNLGTPVDFEVSLAASQGRECAAILQIRTRSEHGYALLPSAKVSVRIDGVRTPVARTSQYSFERSRTAQKRPYEELVSYFVPAALLEKICGATSLELTISDARGTLRVMDEAVAQLQGRCRAFRRAHLLGTAPVKYIRPRVRADGTGGAPHTRILTSPPCPRADEEKGDE